MNLKKHFKPNIKPIRILHTDEKASDVISSNIISWLPNFPREYVVICIGTDRSTGDALGPLTGTLFSEMRPKHITIYGTLHEPVHATNLHHYIKKIDKNHRNPFIIAIDACLGKTSSVGHIIASKGPLKPGAAFNKQLPEVGDIHLTGVVNVAGFMEYSVLQNTRLSFVKDIARQIATALNLIDNRLTHQRCSSPSIVLTSPFDEEMI